ncbi:MAG: hypothetical protein IT580_22515, partial [Verrucomicrobiales bacterium]|nr:hypothetical protein [Verrucomicrobiales bacterium]
PASHRDPEDAALPGPASGRSESSRPRSLGLPQNESTRTALDRLLSRSALAAAVELQTLAPAARRAVCILMLLDADPGQAAHPRAVWLDRLAAFGAQETPPREAAVPTTSEDQVPSGSMAPGKTDSLLQRTPASEDSSTGTGSAPGSTPPPAPETIDPPELGVHLDPRRRGRTAQGGVLYLLNLLKVTDAIAELMREFPGRRLRWTLHQLGCGLTGAAATDPAALAFAGLLPGSVPPTEEEPAATIEERVALQRFMDRIAGEVSTRLDLPPAAPGAVFELVCRRSAEIIADPGWIEAKFSLRDVSLDLRRVGLDLDPGHLPWLGCVVRFTYE